ncbi:MAG: alpha-E domain-containing protein [Rhodosalinus sp.]|uniref:alpha-E domain-containing protein n=1 Tax=Rhodosalinus sp. TaxID=2047741 RepID=UPI00397E30B4
MLSRTAANLFWIARYLERAETTARLMDVGHRNALLPNTGGGFRNEWGAILQAMGAAGRFAEKYGDETRQRDIETFLFFDLDNPASVGSCLGAARENARIVRTALTTQVWDAINGAWQEFHAMQRRERSQLALPDLADWTLRMTALVRGSIEATQLRDDGYHFLNIGYAIERADNTARFLDVKYFVLLPSISYVGSGLDTYQWTTLLRALSAHRAYNWAYGGELTASRIAHFLILNRLFPRSLLSCVGTANDCLDSLARGYGRATPAQDASRHLLAGLAEAKVEEIFDEGLHEFLTRFIAENAALAQAVHDAYLTGEAR